MYKGIDKVHIYKYYKREVKNMVEKVKILDMDKNNYVVKANQFIEAKGRLGILEQKLLATLISEIQIEDKDFQEYKLKISEIGEFIGIKSNAVYERLRETAINLKSKGLSLQEIDPITKKKTFIEVNLIASARHTEGTGELIITVAPDLKPYLLAIKGKETPFTQYMLKNILKLNNSYSIRLYELLKQQEKFKKREIKLEELKEFLGVTAESYNVFSEFERRVLKIVRDEINDKTDIWFNYEKIKTGRKITSILFKIESKDQEKETFTNDIESLRAAMGFKDEYFNDKQILSIYEKAVQMAGNEDIDIFEYIRLNYIHIKDKARNKYAYLIKALENDYAVAIAQIRLEYYIEDENI
jgi:plasmid replication initiation protein